MSLQGLGEDVGLNPKYLSHIHVLNEEGSVILRDEGCLK